MKELTTELYKEAISPAVSEIGMVAGRSVKALLAPIRGFLWGWKRIEVYVENAVLKRLEKVLEEKLKSPDPEIAVPLIQSLTYTARNETLREMYIALLANAMDKDKENLVHPSYVEIIRKMNRLDALVFERLSAEKGYIMAICPHISIGGTNKIISDALPDWYLGWSIEGYSEFDVSAAIVRLGKFGVLELMFDRSISDANYSTLKQSSFLQSVLEMYKINRADASLSIKSTDCVLYVNEYGKQFRAACS